MTSWVNRSHRALTNTGEAYVKTRMQPTRSPLLAITLMLTSWSAGCDQPAEDQDDLPDYVEVRHATGTILWMPYVVEDGRVVVGGDVELGTVEEVFSPHRALLAPGRIWKDGIIYYGIKTSGKKGFVPGDEATIEAAIAKLDALTSFRFVRDQNRDGRVRIHRWGKESQGRYVKTDGKKYVRLPGCKISDNPIDFNCASLSDSLSDDLIAHELLHAAGFFHEQQRPDFVQDSVVDGSPVSGV